MYSTRITRLDAAPPIRGMRYYAFFRFSWLLVAAVTTAGAQPRAVPAPIRTLEDGVVKWTAQPNTGRPRFFDVFSDITGLTLSHDSNQLPFGQSIALLVGISQYAHQDPLPGAAQSVQQLRDYLLRDGGFDVVYEIVDAEAKRNPSASPVVIRDFMRNRLASLGRADRVLFYFAGHGTDRNATTGYLLFRGASKTKIDEDYLATNEIREWSDLIPARHILFMLDACSAGYGFDLVAQGDDLGVLTALGEGRSREIITAGIKKQETFDITDKNGEPITAFGAALLRALQQSTASDDFRSLITVNRLFTDLSSQILAFANQHRVELKPGRFPLHRDGEFVFPNPQARGTPVPKRLIDALNGDDSDIRSRAADLGIQSMMLRFRNAAQEQLAENPVLAYALAAEAFKLKSEPANRKLVFTALSKIDMYYTSELPGYTIEDYREPFILLKREHKGGEGSEFFVYNLADASIQAMNIKASTAWIVPFGKTWRILGQSWEGEPGLNSIPTFRLWDDKGTVLGDAVQKGGLGRVHITNSRTVRIPLYKDPRILVWDLIADRREFIERERKNDSDTYFYDIYGALDTRTDGISAAHYRSGLSLVAADGKILPETYMPVDFDPAFSWATWSADDQYLGLRYAESQRVGIWNPRAKGFVWLDPKGWVAEAYAWSRKGHVLAFTGRTEHQTDVTVQVVDASAPTESKRTVYSGEIPIRTVLFLPGDQRLLVSDRGKNVFVVEISTGKVVAKGSQKNVTKTFGTGDSLYVSSPDVVRVWSNKPAPASGWRFQSSAGRVYRAQGAADALWHWMAVPFVQDKATAGVELRSVISDKKIDLPAPDHDSMSLGFSSDGKWLVLETLKHVRFYEVSTLRFYDFDLMQDDRQFISLRFSNGVVYAHSLGKDWMSNTSNEYDYEIRLDAEPKFVNRTPRKEVRERDQKLDALQKQIDGWDSGTLYGYSSAGLLSATNSDWAYYVKCRDQALGARDCDVQFLPTNLERTMELYDSLVSRPTQERLNSYLQ